MATLVTRTHLDDFRGDAYIDQLLSVAYRPSDTQPDKDAKALARLDTVLADADALIRRHLDARLDWSAYPEEDLANIRPYARDHAIYMLKCGSPAGVDTHDIEMAKQRTLDLVKMRERGLWSGSTAFQQPTPSQYVESGSAFRQSKLAGLI